MQYSPARPRPANNFELYSWWFMRISAVVMVLLVGFHLFYMHIILGVDAINFEVIAQRWESPLWRLYDLFMLVFAWLHCTNGVRIILDDYVHSVAWRTLAKSALYILAFVIMVLGAYIIFTFQSPV